MIKVDITANNVASSYRVPMILGESILGLKWDSGVYCIIKVPKVAEQNPQSCMRNFPIIASDVWYFPKPIYPI